jgi:hypothetical protein
MKVKKLNKYKTELPAKGAFTIETEPDFLKLHTLCLASGRKGGGKSVAIANLVKKAKDKGYYDKIYLITPTYNSNKMIWDIADIQEEDVYEPTFDVLKTIVKNVEAEKQEWDDYLYKKELFKKYKKDIANKPVYQIRGDDLVEYLEHGFLDTQKIEWKYKNEVPPRLAVIIDDCMGTDLMARRTAGLNKPMY